MTIDVHDLDLHDSAVRSISWSANDEDLEIGVSWLLPVDLRQKFGSERVECVLLFRNATGTRVDLEFERFQGRPRIYEADFTTLASGRRRCEMTFGGFPNGSLIVEADHVLLLISNGDQHECPSDKGRSEAL